MKLINEQEIHDKWAPMILESTNVSSSEKDKLSWLTKYCHYHSLNESAAYSFATPTNVPGMGSIYAPTAGNNNGAFYQAGTQGSGDKFPSILPLAIQVAAKTVGFDVVSVIPMAGPTGVLTYLDYVYAGGKLSNKGEDQKLRLLKMQYGNLTSGTTFTPGDTCAVVNSGGTQAVLSIVFVGYGRLDGKPMFRINEASLPLDEASIKSTFTPTSGQTVTITLDATPDDVVWTITHNDIQTAQAGGGNPNVSGAEYVSALEEHISGYASIGNTTDTWTGSYMGDLDKDFQNGPMDRATGEEAGFSNTMGMKTFTKFIETKTYQVAASVTTEQIQDLNKQYGIDVVNMIENTLTNELTQNINKQILHRLFGLGWSNHVRFASSEMGNNVGLNMYMNKTGSGSTFNFWSVVDGTAKSMGTGNSIIQDSVTFENVPTLQRRIYSRILAAGNVISNRGRRGPANFIVTNTKVATALQDNSQFTFAPFNNTINQNNGTLYPVGAIAGMTVYVDPNMAWNDTRILVGRKGGDEEPGTKFMPYMIAESIQTIAENTMAPKIAVKSRYALVDAGFHPETMYLTIMIQQGNVDFI